MEMKTTIVIVGVVAWFQRGVHGHGVGLERALPPDRAGRPLVVSELVKAKYALGLMIRHVGLDMVSLWNETFQTQLTSWSISLLRNTFSADPIPPTQPEAVYYALRTLSTVLEDVKPMEMTVEFSEKTKAFET